jgi:hypothetical protein
MCFTEIHICVWENRGKNCILSLSLKLIRVDGDDFPHPRDSSRNSLFKRSLVDTEFRQACYVVSVLTKRDTAPFCTVIFIDTAAMKLNYALRNDFGGGSFRLFRQSSLSQKK